MRAVVIVLIQLVLAVLVAGLAMPILLVSVPGMREAGPMVLVVLVAILFALLQLVWPAPKRAAPPEGEGHRRRD